MSKMCIQFCTNLSDSKTKHKWFLWKKCRNNCRQWYLSSGSAEFSFFRNSSSLRPVLCLWLNTYIVQENNESATMFVTSGVWLFWGVSEASNITLSHSRHCPHYCTIGAVVTERTIKPWTINIFYTCTLYRYFFYWPQNEVLHTNVSTRVYTLYNKCSIFKL